MGSKRRGSMNDLYLLGDSLTISDSVNQEIASDYRTVQYEEIGLEKYILEKYRLDVTGNYGGLETRNPFGKASGQLSSRLSQVRTDANDGLGFVVLKTVVSQDENAESVMEAWKVRAPKMLVEEIESQKGEKGYTVTWKGRGWDKSFEAYLELVSDSLKVYKESGMPVIPSVQYQLPKKEEAFKVSEYAYTTMALEGIWEDADVDLPFIIEHDFSATLAGERNPKEEIIRWLEQVPCQINRQIKSEKRILGIKLFNPPYEDDFQVEMMHTINRLFPKIVDTITCFNRLFDFDKVYEGKKGVAYGGYDLSDRNLRVLDRFNELHEGDPVIPISATGNINSGRMMVEYALRGATSGQIHTYFQLPGENYNLKEGSRTKKVLHELMFHPKDGLVPIMMSLKNILCHDENCVLAFLDIVNLSKRIDLKRLK